MGIWRFLKARPVVQVSLEEFAELHKAGCLVVDVRETHEYTRGHVPGATSIPLSQLARRAHELPTDSTISVICASGHRSRIAARMLGSAGVDARSVSGGTAAWAHRKLPLVRGAKPR
ncbi:MAG TPA: rhodanese-like domain-containing protein [Candidatus Dormibacteraeota bacterium]|nr:rhodanese-like domain-containing protein [Candidatus Dormibacteraeota bacterium]